MGALLHRGERKLVAFVAAIAAFIPLVSATHQGGSGMYSYFLPAGATVSGPLGLVFVVILPVLIVSILLYLLLENVIGNQRQAQALAILISLFIIPSGGYQYISGAFITLFSFNYLAGVAPHGAGGLQTGPFSMPLVGAILTFVGMAIMFQKVGEPEFQIWEALGSLGAAWVVFTILGGKMLSLSLLVGTVFILLIGYWLFKQGMNTERHTGILVAIIGIVIIGWGLSNAGFLPQNMQNLGGLVQSLGVWAMLAIIVLLVGIVIIVAFYVYQQMP